MSHDDDEIELYGEARQRRIRLVAWVTIIALVLVGGGASVLSLFLG
jgi:hypothetical protein